MKTAHFSGVLLVDDERSMDGKRTEEEYHLVERTSEEFQEEVCRSITRKLIEAKEEAT